MDDLPYDRPEELPEIRPLQLRDKIGFLLYSRELLYHFEPVLAKLDPAEVDLIVYSSYDQTELRARLAELPYAWYDGPELVSQRIGYRLLVSVHVGGLVDISARLRSGATVAYRGYPFRLLGLFNVRFMFSLGADAWNYHDWNQLYDAFLCFGPHQAQRLAAYAGFKFLMGYPRYDRLFTAPLPASAKQELQARFGCDSAKPTLLWLRPLLDYYPGQDAFAMALSGLCGDYNVLVKPHPYHTDGPAEALTALQNYPFTALITESIDNLLLFQLADFVICEYGGTIYSALYTDRPLLLFDHPAYTGSAREDLMQSDTDAWLRRHLPHLPPEQASQLPALLADASLWESQKQIRAWLRELFFAPTYGASAQVGAQLLLQFLTLSRRPGAKPRAG